MVLSEQLCVMCATNSVKNSLQLFLQSCLWALTRYYVSLSGQRFSLADLQHCQRPHPEVQPHQRHSQHRHAQRGDPRLPLEPQPTQRGLGQLSSPVSDEEMHHRLITWSHRSHDKADFAPAPWNIQPVYCSVGGAEDRSGGLVRIRLKGECIDSIVLWQWKKNMQNWFTHFNSLKCKGSLGRLVKG